MESGARSLREHPARALKPTAAATGAMSTDLRFTDINLFLSVRNLLFSYQTQAILNNHKINSKNPKYENRYAAIPLRGQKIQHQHHDCVTVLVLAKTDNSGAY